MNFLMGAQTQELVGGEHGRVKAVQFKDGSEVPADLVVMAVGIRPNTALAEKRGLHCQRGIVVSDTLQTVTDPRIYAVGECAAHRGIAYGLVAPLFEQGKVLRHAPGRVRHRPLHRLAHQHQAQGHRHRPVLRRQLHGRRPAAKRS
jgi:NAD(P)H-nitrite reductase large subunit